MFEASVEAPPFSPPPIEVDTSTVVSAEPTRSVKADSNNSNVGVRFALDVEGAHRSPAVDGVAGNGDDDEADNPFTEFTRDTSAAGQQNGGGETVARPSRLASQISTWQHQQPHDGLRWTLQYSRSRLSQYAMTRSPEPQPLANLNASTLGRSLRRAVSATPASSPTMARGGSSSGAMFKTRSATGLRGSQALSTSAATAASFASAGGVTAASELNSGGSSSAPFHGIVDCRDAAFFPLSRTVAAHKVAHAAGAGPGTVSAVVVRPTQSSFEVSTMLAGHAATAADAPAQWSGPQLARAHVVGARPPHPRVGYAWASWDYTTVDLGSSTATAAGGGTPAAGEAAASSPNASFATSGVFDQQPPKAHNKGGPSSAAAARISGLVDGMYLYGGSRRGTDALDDVWHMQYVFSSTAGSSSAAASGMPPPSSASSAASPRSIASPEPSALGADGSSSGNEVTIRWRCLHSAHSSAPDRNSRGATTRRRHAAMVTVPIAPTGAQCLLTTFVPPEDPTAIPAAAAAAAAATTAPTSTTSGVFGSARPRPGGGSVSGAASSTSTRPSRSTRSAGGSALRRGSLSGGGIGTIPGNFGTSAQSAAAHVSANAPLLVVFGGCDSRGRALAEPMMFHPGMASAGWHPLPTLGDLVADTRSAASIRGVASSAADAQPPARFSHSMAIVPASDAAAAPLMFVCGGTNEWGHVFNDLWYLQLRFDSMLPARWQRVSLPHEAVPRPVIDVAGLAGGIAAASSHARRTTEVCTSFARVGATLLTVPSAFTQMEHAPTDPSPSSNGAVGDSDGSAGYLSQTLPLQYAGGGAMTKPPLAGLTQAKPATPGLPSPGVMTSGDDDGWSASVTPRLDQTLPRQQTLSTSVDDNPSPPGSMGDGNPAPAAEHCVGLVLVGGWARTSSSAAAKQKDGANAAAAARGGQPQRRSGGGRGGGRCAAMMEYGNAVAATVRVAVDDRPVQNDAAAGSGPSAASFASSYSRRTSLFSAQPDALRLDETADGETTRVPPEAVVTAVCTVGTAAESAAPVVRANAESPTSGSIDGNSLFVASGDGGKPSSATSKAPPAPTVTAPAYALLVQGSSSSSSFAPPATGGGVRHPTALSMMWLGADITDKSNRLTLADANTDELPLSLSLAEDPAPGGSALFATALL